jgi:beta-lactam-binding protein with PASTA domain
LARVSRSMGNFGVVPTVLGCSVPQALSILEATGLTNSNLPNQTEMAGTVAEVSPAIGSRVSLESEIRLTIVI